MRANPPAADDRRTYSVADVCRLAGLCDDTIRAAVKRGEFPRPVRVGARLLWPRPVIDAFLAGRAVPADSTPTTIRAAMLPSAPAATSTRPVRTAATR